VLKNMTVKLDDATIADIEAEARSRRIPRSAVVRERLARGKTGKGSLWDLMQDLVIHEDGAPRDLAANKSHLRGYGKSGSR